MQGKSNPLILVASFAVALSCFGHADAASNACKESLRVALSASGPLSSSTIHDLIECFGIDIASRLISASEERRASNTPVARPVESNIVAYRINGHYYAPSVTSTNALAPAGVQTSGADVASIHSEDVPALLNEQRRTLASTIATYTQANATEQGAVQRFPSRCIFKDSTLNATAGLVSLAADAAIYTRSQLGVLALIAPIFFSGCSPAAPPNKPVLRPAVMLIKTNETTSLNVLENGYGGRFVASSSDSTVASVTQDDFSKPVWTVKGIAPGTVVLTAIDEFGSAGTTAITVTP